MKRELHYLRKRCLYNPERPQNISDCLPSRNIGLFYHNKTSQFGPTPNHGKWKQNFLIKSMVYSLLYYLHLSLYSRYENIIHMIQAYMKFPHYS